MDPRDFDRRLHQQPTEAYIKAHSSFVFNNIHTADVFDQEIRDWWHEREAQGWENVPKRGASGAKA